MSLTTGGVPATLIAVGGLMLAALVDMNAFASEATAAINAHQVGPGPAAEDWELRAGDFIWRPQRAPEGEIFVSIGLADQVAHVYRDGVLIGVTTISSGRPGYDTPRGVFTILQKKRKHFSNLYDDAPMPYMQRLTWDGIALHGGDLPGYPASHGCIRLPQRFASLLYGATGFDTVVVVDDRPTAPAGAAYADAAPASSFGDMSGTTGDALGPGGAAAFERFATTTDLNRAVLAGIDGG